uniref:Uncharacterized protein n=1 Tax=Anguilla anguilla TaxID=7936 RepID=A0A0E9VHD8_ANGAN
MLAQCSQVRAPMAQLHSVVVLGSVPQGAPPPYVCASYWVGQWRAWGQAATCACCPSTAGLRRLLPQICQV